MAKKERAILAKAKCEVKTEGQKKQPETEQTISKISSAVVTFCVLLVCFLMWFCESRFALIFYHFALYLCFAWSSPWKCKENVLLHLPCDEFIFLIEINTFPLL